MKNRSGFNRGDFLFDGKMDLNTQELRAGVAQLAEQLICNQQVAGSSPITSSSMGRFPSGQRGQTVNLLLIASVVRIHPSPPKKSVHESVRILFISDKF